MVGVSRAEVNRPNPVGRIRARVDGYPTPRSSRVRNEAAVAMLICVDQNT